MSDMTLDLRGFIIGCPSCAQRNRVAFATGEARCGRCKSALPPPSDAIEVPDSEAFDALVCDARLPVVVDFWAPWCGPCRMVAPALARVAASNAGRFIGIKVNTDALPDLGDRFRIRLIPTMTVMAGGREVARTTGARPAAEIESFVNSASAVS